MERQHTIRLRGLNGYSLKRFSPVWFKLYLRLLTSFLANMTNVTGSNLGLREKTALAFVLSKTNDKEKCKEFVRGAPPSQLIHLAYNLFLLSQVAKVDVSVVNGEFQVGIDKGQRYVFMLIPSSHVEKAPFIHDFHPLIDIFILGEYDFYDVSNGIVIDVGAYIGDSPVYFAKRGARKVFAYEPNPVNFDYLCKNVAANDISDIVVPESCAISSERRSLVVPSDMGGGGTYTQKGLDKLSDEVVYDVPNRDPKSLFTQRERVSLLKLDCKGCEREILRTCLDDLQEFVEHIIVEAERLGRAETDEMASKLAAAGFRLDGIDSFYPTLYFSNDKFC